MSGRRWSRRTAEHGLGMTSADRSVAGDHATEAMRVGRHRPVRENEGGHGNAASPQANKPGRRNCRTLLAAMAIALVLLGAACVQAANPNALWEIVHDQCVPNQERNADPTPCARVVLGEGVARGYAILKDIRGATQFLLIPTARLAGIEAPDLLVPNAPNYLAAAWHARRFVEERAHRTLPRDALSLAINSALARSQNQLHIHIDCARADVVEALREHGAQIGPQWAPLDVPLAGQHYMAIRVTGEEFGTADPFMLLADEVPGARENMGSHTLVVVGAIFPDGTPGFIILDQHADLVAGVRGRGEDLQDHACTLAQP